MATRNRTRPQADTLERRPQLHIRPPAPPTPHTSRHRSLSNPPTMVKLLAKLPANTNSPIRRTHQVSNPLTPRAHQTNNLHTLKPKTTLSNSRTTRAPMVVRSNPHTLLPRLEGSTSNPTEGPRLKTNTRDRPLDRHLEVKATAREALLPSHPHHSSTKADSPLDSLLGSPVGIMEGPEVPRLVSQRAAVHHRASKATLLSSTERHREGTQARDRTRDRASSGGNLT